MTRLRNVHGYVHAGGPRLHVHDVHGYPLDPSVEGVHGYVHDVHASTSTPRTWTTYTVDVDVGRIIEAVSSEVGGAGNRKEEEGEMGDGSSC